MKGFIVLLLMMSDKIIGQQQRDFFALLIAIKNAPSLEEALRIKFN